MCITLDVSRLVNINKKYQCLYRKEFRDNCDKIAAMSFLLRVYFFVARSVTHDAYRPLFYLSNIVYFTHAVYMRSNDIGHSRSRFLATRNSIVSYRRDVGARDMEMSVRDTSAHLDTSVAFRPNYTVNFTRYRMAAFHLSTVTTYTVNARASGVRIAEYKT